ncbi:hypothetical protein COB18_02825 [Candidatus Kaiserbacteria bacterium]|nr:MAG: hypothetical protein COB18_02825 [Candidatus Kaiserbacteria bacterium]
MKRFSQFFVLAALVVVFGSQVVVADDPKFHIGAYYGGSQSCAVTGSGTLDGVAHCCAISTHDLVVRYIFLKPNSDGATATFETVASCIPKEDHKSR